jgi:primosomal replication protein N
MKMTETGFNQNAVEIVGEVCADFEYSHEVFGEKFYRSAVRTPRLSDSWDEVPIMVSERLLPMEASYRGQILRVVGQFRSYNRHEEGRSKLILSVFAREVEFPESPSQECPNRIYLDGYICKPPIYRKTPLGREICDLLIAVNRSYHKSDYIPTIVWGRSARFAGGRNVGDRVRLWGRIQSRTYQKRLGEHRTEGRVAYEVSVSKIEAVTEDDQARSE